MTVFLETGEVLEVVEVLEAAVEVAGGLPAFFLPPGSFLEVSSAFLEVLSCSVSESLSPTKRSLRLNLESGSLFKSLVALSNNFEASLVSEMNKKEHTDFTNKILFMYLHKTIPPQSDNIFGKIKTWEQKMAHFTKFCLIQKV